MNTTNIGLQNSLRCLQHPLTILSIATLLLNDHFLKTHYSSWLTGKLSDFAGLFFFPFIVTAGLSLLFESFKLKHQKIGQIAFCLTAIWFVLLKTIVPFNALTSKVISILINSPVNFIPDSTDLMALVVMVPAWKLWNRSPQSQPSKYAYIALCVGALAVMATSPPAWVVSSVTNLEYYKDGIVYAADKTMGGENSYPVAKSSDGGQTWEMADEIRIRNIEEKSPPITHCSHMYPEICYRVTKSGHLQELNNDETWATAKEFANIKVYDLILFEWEEEEYVIVAIGEYGIMRRMLPDGEWNEISVVYADE